MLNITVIPIFGCRKTILNTIEHIVLLARTPLNNSFGFACHWYTRSGEMDGIQPVEVETPLGIPKHGALTRFAAHVSDFMFL